jgi:hypothetical protein
LFISIRLFYLDLDQQTQNKDQTLMDIDKKLNQLLNDPSKRSDNNQDMDKALQPFSQIIKTLKDSKISNSNPLNSFRFYRYRSISS